jgi:hypothetical protein
MYTRPSTAGITYGEGALNIQSNSKLLDAFGSLLDRLPQRAEFMGSLASLAWRTRRFDLFQGREDEMSGLGALAPPTWRREVGSQDVCG